MKGTAVSRTTAKVTGLGPDVKVVALAPARTLARTHQEVASVRPHCPKCGSGFVAREPAFLHCRYCGHMARIPAGSLLAQVIQEGAVVGQEQDIEIHALRDLVLEIGLAPHEPHRDQEQISYVLSEQRKQRFHEQIGADQGTVQIDAQRDGIRRPGYPRVDRMLRVDRMH